MHDLNLDSFHFRLTPLPRSSIHNLKTDILILDILYNLIATNLADVSRFSNLVSKLKELTTGFTSMYHLSNFINLAESYD